MLFRVPDYRSLDSFEEYMLIEQTQASVEWFRRQPDGDWSIGFVEGLDAVFTLGSLGLELPLKDIYANVDLPIKPVPESDKK